MTATLTPSPSSVAAPVHSTSAGHLPRWAPWALLLAAFVVSATIFAFVNAASWAAFVSLVESCPGLAISYSRALMKL